MRTLTKMQRYTKCQEDAVTSGGDAGDPEYLFLFLDFFIPHQCVPVFKLSERGDLTSFVLTKFRPVIFLFQKVKMLHRITKAG